MNYQKLICWGDSQTFGARTYGSYPLYLSKILNKKTAYTWSIINLSCNGHTARDLWLRINRELLTVTDVYTVCLLIGANDVGNNTPLKLFSEYFKQIVRNLEINGIKSVYCGEIPPIWPDSHPFFAQQTTIQRNKYNKSISNIVRKSSIADLIKFPKLTRDYYVDPVHFNEKGNKEVANCFSKSILKKK